MRARPRRAPGRRRSSASPRPRRGRHRRPGRAARRAPRRPPRPAGRRAAPAHSRRPGPSAPCPAPWSPRRRPGPGPGPDPRDHVHLGTVHLAHATTAGSARSRRSGRTRAGDLGVAHHRVARRRSTPARAASVTRIGEVQGRERTATDSSVAVRERDLDRAVRVLEGEHSGVDLLVGPVPSIEPGCRSFQEVGHVQVVVVELDLPRLAGRLAALAMLLDRGAAARPEETPAGSLLRLPGRCRGRARGRSTRSRVADRGRRTRARLRGQRDALRRGRRGSRAAPAGPPARDAARCRCRAASACRRRTRRRSRSPAPRRRGRRR